MGQEKVSRSHLSQPVLPLVCFMLFLYYTCSGAVERVFQSMATTWSLICKKLYQLHSLGKLNHFFSSSTFKVALWSIISLTLYGRPHRLVLQRWVHVGTSCEHSSRLLPQTDNLGGNFHHWSPSCIALSLHRWTLSLGLPLPGFEYFFGKC